MLWALGDTVLVEPIGLGDASLVSPIPTREHQEGQARMPVPFNLPASSPMTQIRGKPVIFLFHGISSPGEEPEPLAEPLPIWLHRCGREGTLSPCPVVDLWMSGVGYPQ